jgi:hypothetical protein
MKTMLFVCLAALCILRAATAPCVGTWEAHIDGRKAITLEVRDREGILGGSVTLYIVHDDGNGSRDGAPLDPEPMQGTTWDGKVLRFHAGGASWELQPTAADRAGLRMTTNQRTETLQVRRIER